MQFKLLISPEWCHFIAQLFFDKVANLLTSAAVCLLCYIVIINSNQLNQFALFNWLAIIMLLIAIEFLIFSAFLFFFRELHSHHTHNEKAIKFYQIKEWCEMCLFILLLPLPVIICGSIFIKLL